MKRVIDVARSYGVVAAPFVSLALPKCPLCLLPLLALIGVAVPSGAGLKWLIVLITALSLGTFLVGSQVLMSRVLVVFAGPLIAGGRMLTVPPAYWFGVTLLVVAAAIHIRRIARSCNGGSRCRE
jgi:hypothetical protein